MTHNENAAPFPVSHFKSIIFMSNDRNIVQDFGMFTNVKAASGPLRMDDIGLQSSRRLGWRWSGNARSRCGAASPTPPDRTVLLSAASSGRWRPWTDHLSGPAIVSGSLRPRLCAGERWRNEGRRCLSQRCPTQSCWLQPDAEKKLQDFLSPKSRLSYLPDVCLSLSPLHTCEWCRDQHLHRLQCLKTETDSSTNWPGSHQKQGELFQQNSWMLREREAGRENLSMLGTISQMRDREMLRLILIY